MQACSESQKRSMIAKNVAAQDTAQKQENKADLAMLTKDFRFAHSS